MNPRKRIFLLVMIMVAIVCLVEGMTIGILYHTAIAEEKARLEEAAKSQARLIEAVARFDRNYSNDYPLGAKAATIDQIKDAHAKYRGFGRTGEFTLSARENGLIVFVLSHRHSNLQSSEPVAWESELATPMRLALSGKSGTMIGPDYRGKKVLAAYEPVAELDLAIVAKIDIDEIRAPFIRAGLVSGLLAMLVIGMGVSLFFQVTNPIIARLNDTVAKLQKSLAEVKVLRGILPICSFCKKNRDDEGYWNQVDVYMKEHFSADFTHSVCPACMEKHYPEQYRSMLRRKV